MNFLASPEIVTAMAFSDKLTFNPVEDKVDGFKFAPPTGEHLPAEGFASAPGPIEVADSATTIVVSQESQRLQLLKPFEKWDGKELQGLRVLVKVKGKCTTDHISAAGPWLKYKGHLENISENTLIGALNAELDQVNKALNCYTQQLDTIPNVAKDYKERNVGWVVVADENYGEGSAREHAAMQPRFLGCRIVIAKSFARIHETNLKKQGVLPLWFANSDDYNEIGSDWTVETQGLVNLLAEKKGDIEIVLRKGKQSKVVKMTHTLSSEQLEWFRWGSALNRIAAAQ